MAGAEGYWPVIKHYGGEGGQNNIVMTYYKVHTLTLFGDTITLSLLVNGLASNKGFAILGTSYGFRTGYVGEVHSGRLAIACFFLCLCLAVVVLSQSSRAQGVMMDVFCETFG